jgi:predicted nucleotidyltransferase component of viral defense system
MQEVFYREKLYPLQDEVLKVIASLNTDFYLAGGTALGRYYLYHRYSDDLDFFVNNSVLFKNNTEEIIRELKNHFQNLILSLADETFVRLFIESNSISLKIEFVNDVSFHAGAFESSPWFNKIDSWQNILSNKISALSRNEAKDYADILFLSLKYKFNWEQIISDAKEKDMWVNEIEVSKIFSDFDVKRLEAIKWIKSPGFDWHTLFNIIAHDILLAKDNSLSQN